MAYPIGRRAQQLVNMSTEDLILLAEGKKPPVKLTELLRRAVCFLAGHRIVIDRWVEVKTGNAVETHVGCRRCDLFVVEPGRDF